LFSEGAERVELCLFDDAGGRERRIDITEVDGYVWQCFLPGVGPGQRYGYRVHGPHAPEVGLRYNSAKLLLDPYAKAVHGQVRWDRQCTAIRSAETIAPATTGTARRSFLARW